MLDELKVFTGNAHPALAQDICKSLGIPLGQAEVFQFANENTFVRILFTILPVCSWGSTYSLGYFNTANMVLDCICKSEVLSSSPTKMHPQ